MIADDIVQFGDSNATFRLVKEGGEDTLFVSTDRGDAAVPVSRGQADAIRQIVRARTAEDAAASVGSEIERSFLVLPGARMADEGGTHIRQGYLSRGELTIRVRIEQPGSALLTLKRGSGPVRAELEFPIPPSAAEKLLELASGSIIEKVRHVIGPWELDVFRGALAPLVRLEVELGSLEEPLPEFPEGVGVVREITGVPGTSNARMSELGPDGAREFVAELYRGG